MITKDEVATIMELMAYQTVRARENAVSQDRGLIRKAVEQEIKDNLDPEWNHAMRRVLEILDTQLTSAHPVLSAAEIKSLTDKVTEKIERLVPRHGGTF